jgi:predicted nucleic acid-binding protein
LFAKVLGGYQEKEHGQGHRGETEKIAGAKCKTIQIWILDDFLTREDASQRG